MSWEQRKDNKLWGNLKLEIFEVVETKVMMNTEVDYN